jgi:AcrR family transcriptional regulator
MEVDKTAGQTASRIMAPTLKSNARPPRPTERLAPEAWIRAGREALVAGGHGRVKVEPLASALGVTTGSFYWHFKDREALLQAMLRDWEVSNSAGLYAAVEQHPDDPDAQLSALIDVWIDEQGYDPNWDAVVRDWARVDATAEAAVRRIDDQRIELLHRIFQHMGLGEPEAFVRARITYFHQVGYYAMRIGESRRQRLALKPLYLQILKGPRAGD